MQLQRHHGIAHDWNVDTFFRKDRPGRQGGGVALYVQGHLECLELCLRVDDERVESLWVRIKGQTSKGDTVVFATDHLIRRMK